jgi:nickel-dependent lactate racemase
VAIGCAGDATLDALHTPRFLYDPRVRPAHIRENPYQKVLQSSAQRAGLRFVLNAILDPTGQIADVQAGDPSLVHQYLVFAASCYYSRPVAQTYDVVIAGLDPPYDANIYQAVLGALFVGLATRPAVRPGGVILLPARTPEAVGEGVSAQNFYNILAGARSLEPLIAELWERGCRPGEARALHLARLLEQNQIIVVGSEFPEIVEACHLHAAADMDEAIALTHWLVGDDIDALIVPNALNTIPIAPVDQENEWFGMPTAGEWTW